MPAGFIVTTCAGQRRPIVQPDNRSPILVSRLEVQWSPLQMTLGAEFVRSDSLGLSTITQRTYNPSFSLLHREHDVNVARQILIGIVLENK